MIVPETALVVGNKRIAPNCYVLTVQAPALAKKAEPGQFVQLRFTDREDPFLPRPFSFLDIRKNKVQILYQSVGKVTHLMSELREGDSVSLLGPFGTGWPKPAQFKNKTVLLVGGGVGIPPVYHFAVDAKRRHPRFTDRAAVFLGGRTKQFLHSRKEFKDAGFKVYCATDDGSSGHHGTVIERLEDYLCDTADKGISPEQFVILACGPTPMLAAAAQLAFKYDIECLVSMEEHMPCGFGACQGCAVQLHDAQFENGRRFGLCCSEGPVFKASAIVWEALP